MSREAYGGINRLHNRIHKVLEDTNIKLDKVLSDLLGASGEAMVRGMIAAMRTRGDWPITRKVHCAASARNSNWSYEGASAITIGTCLGS